MDYRKNIFVGVGLALVMLLVITVIAYRSLTGLNGAQDQIAQAREVLTDLHDLMSHVVNAESAIRGHVITGEENYLEPYRAAVGRIADHVENLRQLTADNPTQQRQLDALEPLIAQRLGVFENVVTASNEKGYQATAGLLRTNQGQQITDAIRSLLSEMDQGGRELLRQRSASAKATVSETIRVLIIGALLVSVLFLSGFSLHRHEIAQHQRTDEKLTQTAAIVESSLDAINATTLEGTVVRWNKGSEKIYGYSAAEAKGRPVSFLVPPNRPNELPQILKRIKRGERIEHYETVRMRKDGKQIDVSLTVSPVKNARGEITGISAIGRDITYRKQTEERIRTLNVELKLRLAELAATNKDLESFTYSVAHDLRAPLRHIDGFSQLLVEEKSAEFSDQARHYLTRIRNGTRQMGQLVDELLNLARVGRKELALQSTRLNSLVEEVLTDLKPEVDRRVIDWQISQLPCVDCDRVLMKQVFANLLANAVKFTRSRERAVIEVGTLTRNGPLTIFVRDNGVGFNMKYAEKLFGVFQRLHSQEDFEGTGVGLATVQRILHKHSGRIWAQAELDQGASFYFTLGDSEETPPENDNIIATVRGER